MARLTWPLVLALCLQGPPTAPDSSPALLEQAEASLLAGQTEAARQAFARAGELARQAGDRDGQAAALMGEADTCSLPAEREKARELIARAGALAAGTRAERVRARSLYLDAVEALVREDSATAGGLLDAARTAARDLGEDRLAARILNSLGNLDLSRGEVARAAEKFSISLELYRQVADQVGVARLLNKLGEVACLEGRYGEALEKYTESLVLARRISHRDLIASNLNATGGIYLRWGDYRRAVASFRDVLAVSAQNPLATADAWQNTGAAYAVQGDTDLALSFFNKALALYEELGDARRVLGALQNLGTAYIDRGEPARALDFLERARALSRESGDPTQLPGIWLNIGVAREEQGRFDAAAAAYRQSLELEEKLKNRDRAGYARNRWAGLQVRQGHYEAALDQARQAAAAAAETGSWEVLWQARKTMGLAWRGLGKEALARRAFAEAIALAEDERGQVAGGELQQARLFSGRLEPYRQMVELLIEGGDPAAALGLADRSKARTLLAAVTSERLDPARDLTAGERAAEERLHRRLARLGETILRTPEGDPSLPGLREEQRQARLEAEALRAELYTTHPRLRWRRADFTAVTAETLRPLLGAGDTALLEYAVLEKQSYLFTVVLEPAGGEVRIRAHPLPAGRRRLAALVAQLRQRIEERNAAVTLPAHTLHQLLLAPALPELAGKKTLAIVPDGPLWELPFQALETAGGEVLLERQDLFYAPSLAFLAEVARRPVEPRAGGEASLLVVGDPSRAAPRATPLPDAAEEAAEIAALYGSSAAVLAHGAATESRVKSAAPRHRILHFATHALLDDQNPLYSSLVLAAEPEVAGEDGLLEAWEILDLPLGAELVVLAACQTARGAHAGEGVLGLTWAFAVAGSPTVVASQWTVDSAATRLFMVELHRRLQSGEGKSEALRQAALAVRRERRYRHPFYWAGFVLVGDGLPSPTAGER